MSPRHGSSAAAKVRKEKLNISSTVGDGTRKTQFYIRQMEGKYLGDQDGNFLSLDHLYRYHRQSAVTIVNGGDLYEANLVTPVHSTAPQPSSLGSPTRQPRTAANAAAGSTAPSPPFNAGTSATTGYNNPPYPGIDFSLYTGAGVESPRETDTDTVDVGRALGGSSSTGGGGGDAVGRHDSDEIQFGFASSDDDDEVAPKYMSIEALAKPDASDALYGHIGENFGVVYEGPALLPAYPPGGELVVCVEESKWLALSCETEALTNTIKTFLFKVMHAVTFGEQSLTFTYIDDDKESKQYTFVFKDAEACAAFISQLPTDALAKQHVHAGVDRDSSDTTIYATAFDPAEADAEEDDVKSYASRSEKVYEHAKIKAAKATGDHSHLTKNRSEVHEIKSREVIYQGYMVIKRRNKAGELKNRGHHYGQLRRRAGDFRSTFLFEFAKLPKQGASEEIKAFKENADWQRLVLCPYAREVGSKPSKIIDFADDYMFKIRGFDDDNVYEIWPKKPFYDIEPRTPRREKFYWLTHLKQACAEMEGALEGRSQQESLTNAEAVFAFEKDYFRHPLKPGTEKDEIDDQFERFKGTIEVSVYGTKKSGSGFRLSHDKRLLEVVVETLAGQTYAILRYRDDDTSPIIKGFIDLGTDAEKGEADWMASLADLVPTKGNIPPQPKRQAAVSKGAKGKFIKETKGKLTLIMPDRRNAGKLREYVFTVPGTNTGLRFYNTVLMYAKDWKVKKLNAKSESIAARHVGAAALSQMSDLETALRNGKLGTAQTIIERLPTPEESDPEQFIPLSCRGGAIALSDCFPRMDWSILHPSMDDDFLVNLIKLTKAYIQEQIDITKRSSGQAFVAKLRSVVQSFNDGGFKTLLTAASAEMCKETSFAGLAEDLNRLAERATARCTVEFGAPTPKQRTGLLKAVYVDGHTVVEKFDDLMDSLKPFCAEANDVISKDPFRALEKTGLNPKLLSLGWNFSSRTDIVQGVVTANSMEQAGHVVNLLMACDEHEKANSAHNDTVDDIQHTIGSGLAIVGVDSTLIGVPCFGGWRDVTIKFYFEADKNKHVCGIQIVHAAFSAAQQAPGYGAAYGAAMNAMELLSSTGRKVEDAVVPSPPPPPPPSNPVPPPAPLAPPKASTGGVSWAGVGARRKGAADKFVAATIHVGDAEQSAAGLAELMGYTGITLVQHVMMINPDNPMDAIIHEIGESGNEKDQENLLGLLTGTYENPEREDGEAHSQETINAQSKTIDELMQTREAKLAKLQPAHILALRLYTTTTYKSVNNPLRNKPEAIKPHPLAATTYFIDDGLKKLRRFAGTLPTRNNPQTFWRGIQDRRLTDEFLEQGGCEFACMSTTPLKEIAVDFATGNGSQKPLIFQIETKDFIDRGADISFLSVYPDEAEMLYPPLMLLTAIDNTVVEERIGKHHIAQVIRVQPRYPM